MPEYIFNHNGATTGKSGRPYRYSHGVAVVAPAGEFDHLGEGAFTISDKGEAEAALPSGAVAAPLPPGADPSVDVMVSATPGTPPDPAASQAAAPAMPEGPATLSEGEGEDRNIDDSPKAKGPTRRK